MIGIVNYGSGNLGAISNIYKTLRIPHFVSGDLRELVKADRFILPGVGAFDATLKSLRDSGLIGFLEDQVYAGEKKVLGICVGMQILADSSDEGDAAGLGWISGRVRRIPISTNVARVPHMGWNSCSPKVESPLFAGVDGSTGFYFLHSYYFDASSDKDVLATTKYGDEMPCAVGRSGVFGVQFHPEKSHKNGVTVFRNFATL